MLLYLYIGSTVYVWVDTIIHQRYLNKRLKKEGYKFTSKNYFGFADIVIGSFYLIALSVPVFNLLFPISHINKERSYDEYKNYLDESGSIEKIETKDITNIYSTNNMNINNKLEKNIITVDKHDLEERISRNGHIYYSSIQNDEELEDQLQYTYKKTLKK